MKYFREPVVARGQVFLLPPSVEDFVPQDSLARIVDEIIEGMDLSELVSKYTGGGAPAYNPWMMMKVLVFGYSQGTRSSRKLAMALGQDLRFMYLAEMSRPDFRTIARFRTENLDAVKKAFSETVRIACGMGMVVLEHVSVDGTKIEANVSGKETYGRKRLEKTLADIEDRISEILREAEEVDEAEDAAHGDRRGDEVDEDLKDLAKRKERLAKAREAMEEAGRSSIGATDTESRLMKTGSGNRAAYNGQAVVDAEHGIIVAADVTQDESDNRQLVPMMEQTKENTGAKPETVTADGGYYGGETLRYAKEEGLDAYIPDNSRKEDKRAGFEYDEAKDEYRCPEGNVLKFCRVREVKGKTYRVYRCYRCSGCVRGEICHGKSSRYKELCARVDGELEAEMSAKMKSEEGRLVYRLRKQIVEPVFGNIKANKGLRRLLLRGLDGAKTEYYLACIAHNIGKIGKDWREMAVPAVG